MTDVHGAAAGPRPYSSFLRAGRKDRPVEVRAELAALAQRLQAIDDADESLAASGAAAETLAVLAKLHAADLYATRLAAVWGTLADYELGILTAADLHHRLMEHAMLPAADVPGFDGAAFVLYNQYTGGGGVVLGCGQCDEKVATWERSVLTLDHVNVTASRHTAGCEGRRGPEAAETLAEVRCVLADAGLIDPGAEGVDLAAVLRGALRLGSDGAAGAVVGVVGVAVEDEPVGENL